MTAKRVTVVDAGVGNLGNVERAVRSLGYEPDRTSDPEVVAASRRSLLPGVGAFRPPRERLRGALEEAFEHSLGQGGVLMGICVGYQLLFESSEEFGETDGLGLLQGHIKELPSTVPVPHIGWNRLTGVVSSNPLLQGIDEGSYAYFVHSFAPDGAAPEETLAECRHGRSFAAVSARGNVFGTQFHPEKSSTVGLKILENFLRYTERST
ncbi:MAG: imidazole glycerol phosphate synthase subunit HisH [Acidobacteriota bacterium]